MRVLLNERHEVDLYLLRVFLWIVPIYLLRLVAVIFDCFDKGAHAIEGRIGIKPRVLSWRCGAGPESVQHLAVGGLPLCRAMRRERRGRGCLVRRCCCPRCGGSCGLTDQPKPTTLQPVSAIARREVAGIFGKQGNGDVGGGRRFGAYSAMKIPRTMRGLIRLPTSRISERGLRLPALVATTGDGSICNALEQGAPTSGC